MLITLSKIRSYALRDNKCLLIFHTVVIYVDHPAGIQSQATIGPPAKRWADNGPLLNVYCVSGLHFVYKVPFRKSSSMPEIFEIDRVANFKC